MAGGPQVNMAAHDAWIFMAGVVMGLFLAAGAVAWAVHYLRDVVQEAREVIENMGKVVSRADAISHRVAENYVPLAAKVDEIEREVNDIRTLLSTGRG